MAVAVFLALILAMVSVSDATWCICRSDLSDQALQKTLDYACGAGADCTPILQNGPCFQPNTVRSHCSYAVNSFFQRKGQVQGSCDFQGTAIVSQTDPSTGSTCIYPSSFTSAPGITNTPTTTTTTTTSPTTTTTTPTMTPNILTPSNPSTSTGSGLGGLPNLSPSGFNNDLNNGGEKQGSFFISLSFSVLILSSLW